MIVVGREGHVIVASLGNSEQRRSFGVFVGETATVIIDGWILSLLPIP